MIKPGTALARIAMGGIYLFILAPVIVVVILSFTASNTVSFPITSFSLRWFGRFFEDRQLVESLVASLLLAFCSSAISLVLGTLAAFAIVRGTFPGRDFLLHFMLLPIVIPGLVLAMALLDFLAAMATPTRFGLLASHVVITLPYVVRTLVAGLQSLDPQAEQAAVSLGCSRMSAFILITIPMLSSSIVASSLFALIVSFEDLPMALLLSDPYTITLPMRIYTYIQWTFDPMVAAASTINLLIVIFLVFITERTVGLSRLMGISG